MQQTFINNHITNIIYIQYIYTFYTTSSRYPTQIITRSILCIFNSTTCSTQTQYKTIQLVSLPAYWLTIRRTIRSMNTVTNSIRVLLSQAMRTA